MVVFVRRVRKERKTSLMVGVVRMVRVAGVVRVVRMVGAERKVIVVGVVRMVGVMRAVGVVVVVGVQGGQDGWGVSRWSGWLE